MPTKQKTCAYSTARLASYIGSITQPVMQNSPLIKTNPCTDLPTDDKPGGVTPLHAIETGYHILTPINNNIFNYLLISVETV